MPLPKEKNEKYTYRDYCTWPDEERWEIIDGIAFDMTPAPNMRHQGVLMNLVGIVGNLLHKKPYFCGLAPLDVVFSDTDIVQPDFLIVSERSKITEKNIQGAPDVIFEILSPLTSKKDRWEKRALYEKYGVKEYILIYPDSNYLERYTLGEDGCFDRGELFEEQDTLELKSVPDLVISMNELFLDDLK